jgi:hypothetical protein
MMRSDQHKAAFFFSSAKRGNRPCGFQVSDYATYQSRKELRRKSSRAEIKGVNVMSSAFLTFSDFHEVSRAGRP